jgi:hypothetical protein
VPDPINLAILLAELNGLPPQTTRWTLPSKLVELLVGYTINLRVEATPFFTGDVAVGTLRIKLHGKGASDAKLNFANNFKEFRFNRIEDSKTPEMRLLIPPCLLEGKTEKAYRSSL